MKENKMMWPMFLGVIGSVIWLLMAFGLTFLANGGRIGTLTYDFGDRWLAVSIISIVCSIIGLVGASMTKHMSKLAGILMLIGVAGYVVVSILIAHRTTVPFIILSGIAVALQFVSALLCIIYPEDTDRIFTRTSREHVIRTHER